MTRKQQLLVIISLLISIVFLWFAFRELDPEEVFKVWRTIDIGWTLIAAVWYMTAIYVIAWRWQFLLKAVKFVSMRHLFPLVCIGYMGNNVYPFRSGEALRIFLLRRNHQVPVIKATTTVLIERVFDGIVMLTFIVIPLRFVDIASDEIRRVVAFATPIFAAASLVFFVLAARPDLLRMLVRVVTKPFPQRLKTLVEHLSEEVIGGLEGLRSPADLAGAVLTSYGTWLLGAVSYWLVSLSFGFEVNWAVILLIVGAVNLAGLIPASPGQIGIFEFFAPLALVSTGIAEADALAYAIVIHVVIWLPVTLAGFYYLVRQGLGLDAISHAREMEEQAVSKT